MTQISSKRINDAPRIDEHDEQANFITVVYMQYGNRDDFAKKLLFAVPNGAWFGGAHKGIQVAMFNKFRSEGFQQGVADLIYLQPRGGYNCLAIEMKAVDRKGKKGAVSEDQEEFLQAILENGGLASVCYGCDEALAVFDNYMRMEPRKDEDK
jgi:hypothetical protein